MRRSPSQVNAGAGAEGGEEAEEAVVARWEGGGLCSEGGGDAQTERGKRKPSPKSLLGAHGAPGGSAPEASGAARFGLETMVARGWRQLRESWGAGATRGVSVSRA